MTITDHAPFNKSLISYGRTVLPKKMTFLIGNNSRMTFDDHTKKKKKKKKPGFLFLMLLQKSLKSKASNCKKFFLSRL